jgi:hypothetical protein
METAANRRQDRSAEVFMGKRAPENVLSRAHCSPNTPRSPKLWRQNQGRTQPESASIAQKASCRAGPNRCQSFHPNHTITETNPSMT